MRLLRWNKNVSPAADALREHLAAEGLSFSEWVDSPGTVYPTHSHAYAQVRLVVRGHLRVGLPETGEEIVLGPGDRLDLPPTMPHWEDVNTHESVTYLAAAV